MIEISRQLLLWLFLKQIESKAKMHPTTNWNVTFCLRGFLGNLTETISFLKCLYLGRNCDPRRSNFHIFVYLPELFFILTFIANISSVVMLSASFRSTLNQHWISATWQTFWNRISLSVSLFFSDTGWMQPIKCESELNLGWKAWANEILKNINNRALQTLILEIDP